MYCIGLSGEIPLFVIFEIGYIAADQLYLYEFNSPKLANLAVRVRGKIFIFKNKFVNICPSLAIFLGPQNGQHCF